MGNKTVKRTRKRAQAAARKVEEKKKLAAMSPLERAAMERAREEEEKRAALEKRQESKQRREEEIYQRRFQKHREEFRQLYLELYNSEEQFEELCKSMKRVWKSRSEDLKAQDLEREERPEWFRERKMLGMSLYVDRFAKNLQGVREKLDYVEACGVNYLQLMPLMESQEWCSDEGSAVTDFEKIQGALGKMEDLAALAKECHRRGICLCVDFAMNHTSQEHEWAVRARAGEEEYRKRYFFFDNYSIPAMYEKTVPQVFPSTAPGNFTYLQDIQQFVMTTFYPGQWDLNYQNPEVFRQMILHFLFLTSQGVDVVRMDDIPYIWKQIGTECRNLPQVHTILRMIRMITEIVCPGVLLAGAAGSTMEKTSAYFGECDKPECHLLYNTASMSAVWNSVATRDVRLLKRETEALHALPSQYTFLNYLRCHREIPWDLDYDTLRAWGMEEESHRRYLNEFFTGDFPGSFSRGAIHREDGRSALCATTASMCGIEKALLSGDETGLGEAVRLDVMVHGWLLFQSGVPVLCSGDEVGQTNDYTYRENPQKAQDHRHICRGAFPWENRERLEEEDSVQQQIFTGLKKLEEIRKKEPVFGPGAQTWTLETWDDSVICLVRAYHNEKMIGLFNFSENERMAWINEQDGGYTDLITGEEMAASGIRMGGYQFLWLRRNPK